MTYHIPLLLITFVVFWGQAPSTQALDGIRVIYTYEQDALGKALHDFGSATGIPITADFRAQNDLKPNLLAMDTSQLPDAIIMPADHVGIHTYVNYSVIDPVWFKAQLPERLWASAHSDGNLYGVPLIQGNHLMLFYNKGLVKAPAGDWQAMRAQHLILQAQGVATVAWNYDEPYYFLPFLGAFGGWPLRHGQIELNTPAMVEALDFYAHLKDLRPPDCLSACARALFKSGKVAYVISGVWDGVSFQQALGDNLGLAAIPRAGNRAILSPFSTHLIAFPNESLTGKKRAQLIRLVDYLQSPAIQRRLWDTTGAIPVEAGALAYAQQHAKGYLKQTLVLLADTKAVPADQSMSIVWDALSKGMARHRTGHEPAQETVQYMQALAERYLRSMRRLKERHHRKSDSSHEEGDDHSGPAAGAY